MLAKVRKIAHRITHYSPADNVEFIRARLSKNDARNDMLDTVLASKRVGAMLGRALKNRGVKSTVLLGDSVSLQSWLPGLREEGVYASVKEWNWDSMQSGVIARVPYTAEHWDLISRSDCMALPELLGPFTLMHFLASKFDYYMPMEEALPLYLGHEFFGPLQELSALFNLAGKRVIEFGPFDGYQTCGLTYLGASVTAIEARAENVIKTRSALDALGLNAKILVDDFHNASAKRYGRFDLAFAHGVYYHSVAPFVFLNNLIELADRVFIGGFYATDETPAGPWESLENEGKSYRVKPYAETAGFTAGLNRTAYFFHAEDLMAYFTTRGFSTTVISDESDTDGTGKFLRFLAIRAH